MQFGRKVGLAALILAMTLFVGARYAKAQSLISGDIAGTVTDPSGAAIPGATVVIANAGTGAIQTVKTGGAGGYRVGLLQPGQYTVKVSAPGFQTTQRSTAIAVGQTATVNMQLGLAKGVQTVQVEGTAVPILQTENSDLSTTITQQQVQNLPNPGGDITNYINLTQGVVMNSQGGYGNSSAFGLPATSNNFTVNGAEDNDPFLNLNNSGPSNLLLGSNDIAEVNIVANAYSAQYGALGGVQENIITRSGTNQFHGNATYYWTNSDMNANNWFNDNTGAPQAFSNANQWGAAIGGPIKRNRAWFFVNYEGLRFVTSPTDEVFVPSASYEAAVISNLTAYGNAAEIPFYNNIFSLYNAAPGSSRATPYQGLSWMNSFVSSPRNNLAEVLTTARLDLKLGPNDTGFIHFKRDHGVQPTEVDPINPVFNEQSDQPDYEGQIEETHTFSPNVVNQFILSGMWYSAIFKSPNEAASLAAMPYTLQFDDSFTNLGNIDYVFPQGRNVTQYQANDDVSWIHGKHTTSFGVLFKRDDVTDADLGVLTEPIGVAFGPGVNGPLDPTYDLFSQGYMLEGIQNFPTRSSEPIATLNLGVYVQDQWKPTSNLEVSAGVRFEHNGNPVCGTNCFARLGNTYNQVTADMTTPYNKAIAYGLKSTFNQLESIAVLPRVGFTYSLPNHHTTLFRGGFGMFTDAFPATIADSLLTNAPLDPEFEAVSLSPFGGTYAQNYLLDPSQPGSFTQSMAATNAAFVNGFASGGSYDTISAADPNFTAPGVTNVDQHIHYPTYEEWSLQIQQQIGHHDGISIGYVGNHGYHEPVENNGVNTSQADVGGPFGGLPANTALPAFDGVNEIESAASSNYNGLFVSVQHQSKVATAMLNYTWSHSLDEISNGGILPFGGNAYNPIDPFDLKLNYGNADYDIRHNLNANYIVTVPYVGGPKLLTDRWQLGGTLFWHTGFPFSVTDSNATSLLDATGTYGGTMLADIVNPNVPHHCGKSAVYGVSGGTPCFSAIDFADPTSFTGPGTQRRNQFFGPGWFSTDFTLMKGFKIPGTEAGQLQVGADAYNVLNHTNFANPDFDADSAQFGNIFNTVSVPTSVFGSFLGGDSSPRILQLKANIQF
jgi:hypothetical protein